MNNPHSKYSVEGLEMPDLRPLFKHLHWRPMPHSMGVPVGSDWADRPANDPVFGLYKNCGVWTLSEAAILFNIAKRVQGNWLDIGAHTGWTGAHEAAAGNRVFAVDNMLAVPEFAERFRENTREWDITAIAGTSNEFFAKVATYAEPPKFSGVVIDGDHCSPCPLQDAMNAEAYLAENGVILFHDFIGRPVREGVEYLMAAGFKCKVYWTPHIVACCWRGDLHPPDHVRDPLIDWESVKRSMSDFDFGACA
jgi:hypothetical protein